MNFALELREYVPDRRACPCGVFVVTHIALIDLCDASNQGLLLFVQLIETIAGMIHALNLFYHPPHLLLSAAGWAGFTHLPSLEHLIAKQEVAGNTSSACDAVPEHSEAVVNTLLDRVHLFS
jgi:hypothetical protein